MASPRVFISSTCFDLAEVRDSLISFCQGFGFEVVMSDKGDVFYHPDLHTHESCINEVSNCQIFILIIGGRFGGKYKVDPSKSITNAEYNAAKEIGIPVFTFVKEDVLSDHHVFQRNKGKEFSSGIEYPSIEKQTYAENIFNFIDIVRSSGVNNGFFGFKYARHLHESLRKQWAGLFFEFLTQRSLANQLKSTSESITNLSIASKKIEELIKNVYRQVDEVGANDSINTIDSESEASEFFIQIGKIIGDPYFVPSLIEIETAKNPPDSWWEFLLKIDGFEFLEEVFTNDDRKTSGIIHKPSDCWVSDIDGQLNSKEKKLMERLKRSYETFKSLPEDSRVRILQKYDDLPF